MAGYKGGRSNAKGKGHGYDTYMGKGDVWGFYPPQSNPEWAYARPSNAKGPRVFCVNYNKYPIMCGGNCFYGQNPPAECKFCHTPFDFSQVAKAGGVGKGKGRVPPSNNNSPVTPDFDSNKAASVLISKGIKPEELPGLFNEIGIIPSPIKPGQQFVVSDDAEYKAYTKARGKYNDAVNTCNQQEAKLASLMEQVEASRKVVLELRANVSTAKSDMELAQAKVKEVVCEAGQVGQAAPTTGLAGTRQDIESAIDKLSSTTVADSNLGASLAQIAQLLTAVISQLPGQAGTQEQQASNTNMGDGVHDGQAILVPSESHDDDVFPHDWGEPVVELNGGDSSRGFGLAHVESPQEGRDILDKCDEVMQASKALKINSGGKGASSGNGGDSSSSSAMRSSPYAR